jgi:hypothetical protein
MEPETSMILPPPPVRMEVPALIPPPAATPHAPPTPEQVQAADAVFTGPSASKAALAEAHAVEGLLGMWAGTLLLHDLAKEHFGKARDREEEKPLLRVEAPEKPG